MILFLFVYRQNFITSHNPLQVDRIMIVKQLHFIQILYPISNSSFLFRKKYKKRRSLKILISWMCIIVFPFCLHRNNFYMDTIFSWIAHLYKRMCIPTCMTYAYFSTVFEWIPQRKGERKDVVYHVIQYNHMCTPMFFRNTFCVQFFENVFNVSPIHAINIS